MLKLSAVFVTLAAIVVVERLGSRAARLHRARQSWWCRTALTVPATIVMLAAVVSSPFALASRLPASALSGSSIGRAASLLVRSGSGVADGTATSESTLAAFRQLTHSARAETEGAYVGRERDSDVIVFMMETGAARALDLAVTGSSLPGVGPLYPRAFVGVAPLHERIPTAAMRSTRSFRAAIRRAAGACWPRRSQGAFEGLMTNAAEAIPVRRVYVPSLYHIELDDRMYEAFGAESIYASDERRTTRCVPRR